jgi:hypothetical protein
MRPNIVIHVTDSIYAFNFMTENPDLTYQDARVMARAAGLDWVNGNLTDILLLLDFIPAIFHWDQWDEKHGEEYVEVLAQLTELQSGDKENLPEFRSAVEVDVDRFVTHTMEKRAANDVETDSPERDRIRRNSLQLVLHENAGYILIGRHIIRDYMDVLRENQPDYATVIEAHGGLMDGAFRIYPGGQLKSIEWLQKNRRKLPQSLWGAERVTPIKIEFRHIETSNENAFRTAEEIEFLDNLKRINLAQR